MKAFLVLLFLGLACSEKLDLTYLPPPGSQYAGGRPGDIQTPLEFPKHTYSTTRRPNISGFGQENLRPEDIEASIGINRVPPRIQNQFDTQGPNEPFANIQTHGLPSTTVSYAFTQTTTHPPSEAFDTTINPITGLPNFPSLDADHGINQYYPNAPGVTNIGNNFGSQQPVNIKGRPIAPGFQTVVDQYGNQQPSFSTTPGTVTKFPGSPVHFQTPKGEIYVDQSHPGITQFESDYHQTAPGFVPQTPLNQFSRNQTLFSGSTMQPEFISSTTPYPSVSSSFSGATYDESVGKVFSSARPTAAHAGSQGESGIYSPGTRITPQGQQQRIDGLNPQQLANQNQFQSTTPQQVLNQNRFYDGSQIPQQLYPGQNSDPDGSPGVPSKDISKPYQPFTTPIPSTSSQGLINEQNGFDSSRYDLPLRQGSTGPTVYRQERPQAESDRNAVILNYESVITPEGFAYSFDTSNGIHADESGTAIDGVKAKGSFSYIGDDGKVYTIVYTADENGYQPHGDHLPTPPPIPEAIQRVIEQVQQEKEAGIIDDGSYDEDKYGYKQYDGYKDYNPQDSDDGVNFRTSQEFESKRPLSGGANTGYKDGNVSHRHDVGDNEFISDNIRKQPNPDMTLGSDSRMPGKENTRTSIGNIRKGSPNKQISESLPTRNPFVNINNVKQYGNRRRPDQEYSLPDAERENTGFDTQPDDNSERKEVHIKGTTSRPTYEQGNVGDKIFETVHDVNKTHKGPSRQPITDLGEEHEDDAHIISAGDIRHPTSARPSDQVFVDKNGYVIREDYNRKGKPATTVSPKYSNTGANVDYDSEDYKTTSQPPLRQRPGGIKKPFNKIEQTIPKIRRPQRPGLRVNQNEDNKDYIDENYGLENDSENDEGLGSTQGPVYDTSEDSDYNEYKPHKGQYKVSSKPPRIFSTKYAASQDRPQAPEDYEEKNIENGDSRVRPNYGQIVSSLPNFAPRTGIVNNKQKANETGYQYIPPLTKFDEVNNFPGRVSTTRIPSQQTTYFEQGSTASPHVNPNESRVTYNPEEQYDGVKAISGFPTRGKPGSTFTENYDKGRPIPSQGYYDEVASTTRPFSKPLTSTYGPGYQTTRRPTTQHYGNQYSQTPSYTITPQGTLVPSQSDDGAYYQDKEFSTRRPLNPVSSTTSAPSHQPTYYDTFQKETIAPRQHTHYTEGTRKPGQIFASTTPLPSHSAFDGAYNPDRITSGPTSFRTMEPVSPTNDYSADIAASRLPNSGPTTGPGAHVENTNYGSRLPSTTYRPNYTIVSKDGISSGGPGAVVDRYGRPILVEPHDDEHNFSSGGAKNVLVDNIPGLDGLNRPLGFQTSTKKIIGEDFSGPKQQQKFDPETGYYY